jgi:hypothetical protein
LDPDYRAVGEHYYDAVLAFIVEDAQNDFSER